MQQFAFGETGRAEGVDIADHVSFAVQDQVSQNAAGCGRVHHTVSAEAVGAEEAGYVFDRTEDAVMVGRHLVESRPGALGIDGDVLEARNPSRRRGRGSSR